MDKKKKTHNASVSPPTQFPPVVVVVGHVDHGKTSLLDAIRRTNIAEREHGGITQRIGASRIFLEHEGTTRSITFIDTPGHEAFAKMRGRGTQVADIGLLVVSLPDGVQPQTKESILLLKETKIPYIVVLTKADVADTNPEKVKQQLLKEDVLLEGYGGDVPVIVVSAKTGQNIKELLDLILLIRDLHAPQEKPTKQASLKAVVVESRVDSKAGPLVTVVIKEGTLSLRDEIYTEKTKGRVRMLLSDRGEHVRDARKGEAVEILGFEKAPSVGSVVSTTKELVSFQEEMIVDKPQMKTPQTAWDFLKEEEKRMVSLILVADALGSLEAIVAALPKEVHVISEKTGDITENDVFLAKSTGAIILGFNTKIRPGVAELAKNEKILVKNYTIIYEMLHEIQDLIEGKQLALEEKILGKARILARFPFEKTTVLGVQVIEGRIARGDRVRLQREDRVLGESIISSLRQGKQQTSKVEAGTQGGVLLSPFLDFQVGDVLVCYSI